MARRQFKTPFAATGDTVSIPLESQPDGSVSMEQGYGFDYQRDPLTDPLAKAFPREPHNGILNEITASIGEIQQNGYAIWSTEGAPYPINAQVRHGDSNWINGIANNSASPSDEDSGWLSSDRAILGAALRGNNLSDLDSAEDARNNLGLREGATRDVSSGSSSSPIGSLITLGDYGYGRIVASTENINNLNSQNGFYRVPAGAEGAPAGGQYEMMQMSYDINSSSQILVNAGGSASTQVTVLVRNKGADGWTPPVQLYHSGNSELPVGYNQNWASYFSSRNLDTTYTNTTGRTIFVFASAQGDDAGVAIQVDGLVVLRLDVGPGLNSLGLGAPVPVPAGSTYRVTTLGGSLRDWCELR